MTKYFDGMGKDVTAYVLQLETDKQALTSKLADSEKTIQKLSKKPRNPTG